MTAKNTASQNTPQGDTPANAASAPKETEVGLRLGELASAVASINTVESDPLDSADDLTREDWEALRACANQLDAALRQSDRDTHELRNLASALRGYAEMLSESSDALPPEIQLVVDSALASTLEPTSPGESSIGSTRLEAQSIKSEPGFILAVDDRVENRELLARYLTRSGHFVVTAPGGVEALEMLENADVDVVLLDRMMPEMSGEEVLRKIKAEPRWRATPVIMISGEQDTQGIIDCIEAGADDYLFKPFNPVLLQARIKAGIERKRWHDREELYRQQLERSERFIRATFGRYLSDDIVSEILERPEGLELGGDLRDVTILMSDIRGFTTLSEQLPPATVVSLLNRYLGAMTDIILRHGGTIDEFLGDAILAVFGAPKRHSDDPDRAARCALEMQAAMTSINESNAADGLPVLAMGIALNTGKVIAGNIGSERRSKYGFVGHAMNVTSRIEDVAGEGEILIADSTRQALREAYSFGDTREVNAAGIDEVLTVHALQETGA